MQAMLQMDKLDIKKLKQAFKAKGKLIRNTKHKLKREKP